MTHIVLTRAEPDAKRQLALLSARGHVTTALPLIAIEPVVIAPEVEADLEGGSVIIFTSANAVAHGLSYVANTCRMASTDVFAVGKKTREALREQGVEAQSPEREDSEGLLELLAPEMNLWSQSSTQIALIKGEGGRDLLSSELIERGFGITEVNCYRRIWPPITRSDMLYALDSDQPRFIHIASGETLSRLEELCDLYGVRAHEKHTVILPSERVDSQARELGWQSRIVVAGASDEALLDALPKLF